jgi:carbon-monoxide dehydrogenase large subunit
MRSLHEDGPLLTGAARFVGDLRPDGMCHAAFVRSPVAHARVAGIDARAARRLAEVYTADDLALPALPSPDVAPALARPLLATGTVRFVGEPVAVVLADDPLRAADAAVACQVAYDPLPAVTDPLRAAADDAPRVFPALGSNVALSADHGYDRVDLSHADVVVRARFTHPRVAPVPLEPGGVLVTVDDGGVVVRVGAQEPATTRDDIAAVLGLAPADVRVVGPHVGGAFGGRIPTYPEHVVVAALAWRLGVAVRHVETRSENLVAMIHGRGQIQDVEVGARRDGTLVGLRAALVLDLGAYPRMLDRASLTTDMLSGAYRLPQVGSTVTGVVTNAPTVRAYRGVGRVEATALVERAVDLVAGELGLDPLVVRRRNLIPSDAYPYITATGRRYDSGDLPAALDAAVSLVGYSDARRDQRRRRAAGATPHRGIGISAYVTLSGWDDEHASIEIAADGRVLVSTGAAPSGQGHATVWARLLHDALGIDPASVIVRQPDTQLAPGGAGTWGSRSLQTAGNAVVDAAATLRERATRLAADRWDVDRSAVVIDRGRGLRVDDGSGRRLSWAQLAASAGDGRIAATAVYGQDELTAPSGAHIAVVDVDPETGRVTIVAYVAVDDAGRVVEPQIAEGQVHGGVVQGIGEALHERFVPAGDGPSTATLHDYPIPGAPDVPAIVTRLLEVPAPGNPLGVKGVGESGVIGAVAAVRNAVIDALAHRGVRHIDVPLTPQRVWRALRDAEADRRDRPVNHCA